MSASNEWTDWHLTPAGWVKGTESTDFGGTVRERPADAVCTYRWREHLSSTYSKVERGLDEIWRSTDKVAIQALTAKFGACPQRL
ncbi:translation initiation factor 1 [Roseateles sp. NT4]|uniref:translation initiation factor 1 n=1 Tax=Roseateles sp. NT4 TaxID=3453715 RepID=UPI003EEE2296